MRREAAPEPGCRVEASPTIVRHVGTDEPQSFVLFSDLSAGDADAEIAAQTNYFRALGHEVEWKTYSHDGPPDLVARLECAGFVPQDEEALVVLDLEGGTHSPQAPPGVVVRRLGDPSELDSVERIYRAVWGEDRRPGMADWLRREMAERPDSMSVYVAHVEGEEEAAAVGRITFEAAKPFAGLWGGSTAPEHRGRGLYRALVAARVAEARARPGVRFVTVDALPTSHPILERLGFVRLTDTRPCVLPAAAAPP